MASEFQRVKRIVDSLPVLSAVAELEKRIRSNEAQVEFLQKTIIQWKKELAELKRLNQLDLFSRTR